MNGSTAPLSGCVEPAATAHEQFPGPRRFVMRDSRPLLCLPIFLIAASLSASVQAASERTTVRTDQGGVYQIAERANDGSGGPSGQDPGEASPGGTRDGVIWHRSQTDAMYT